MFLYTELARLVMCNRKYAVLKMAKGKIKGNQKGNIKCYARERANTKQPF